MHYDRVAVDTTSGDITSRTRWADHPALNKLSKLGAQGHTGIPAVAALGWALPVPGVTLAGFLVVDAVVGAVRRRRTA